MSKLNQHGYYRKPCDILMWGEFDALVTALRTNKSALITEAVREYVANHKGESVPAPVPPGQHRAYKPGVKDPFADA